MSHHAFPFLTLPRRLVHDIIFILTLLKHTLYNSPISFNILLFYHTIPHAEHALFTKRFSTKNRNLLPGLQLSWRFTLKNCN